MVSVWQWIKNQIVQEVPENIALCEFDCSKQQCSEKEWEKCPRRIARAAGELMPASNSEYYHASDTLTEDFDKRAHRKLA